MPHVSSGVPSLVEALESRIAPALLLVNPLADFVAGSGKTGATIDLSKLTDAAATHPNRTLVQFTTNLDIDPATPGIQGGTIVLELLDDVAPLTVQNFLGYLNSPNAKADYDGTIIHRSADLGGEVGNDIVQGGGYAFPALGTHLPTGPQVHEEYDAAHPNVRGTIAMARTGLSLNTATSEWFFNVHDNSTIFSGTNTYTVFGEVIQGLDVLDALGSLATFNQSGFATLPLQNYASGTPTADQVIKIVEAKVLPNPGNSAGLIYTVEHLYQAGTTTDSTLLTTKVSGAALNLNFAPGQGGLADVVVKVSDGTSSVTDTFRVDVRPNLILNVHQDALQTLLVPGDHASIKIDLTNNGAALAKGTVQIDLRLAKTQLNQATGKYDLLDPLDSLLVGSLDSVALSLAGGKTKSFSIAAQVPAALVSDENTVYRLIAIVTPETGAIATGERFDDDNVGLDGGNHQIVNQFGNISTSLAGSRTGAVLSYTALDALGHGTLVTWKLTGPGQGHLAVDLDDQVDLDTHGTTAASILTTSVSQGSAHALLDDASLTDALGNVKLGGVDVSGNFTASGGVKTLVLGDLTGQSLLQLGTFPPDNSTSATITLGRVRDFSLESLMPIVTLTALEWLDTAGSNPDTLAASSLGTLKITGSSAVRGDFEADLTLTGDAPLKSVAIAGLFHTGSIQTAGAIGTVTVGGITQSQLFAGLSARPATADDLATAQSLGSFTVKGIKAFVGSLFADAQVAAQTIGTIKLSGLDSASGSGDFGFVAGVIKSYSRTGGLKASHLESPQNFDRLGNYVVAIL